MRTLLRLVALLLLPATVMAQGTASPTEYTPQQLPLQYEAAPATPVHTAYPPVVPPSSPLRRVAPADSRLTCEDYSKSYFSRHPAMAAVCGITQTAEEPAEATVAPAATPSSTQP